jgi:hypothetical protein
MAGNGSRFFGGPPLMVIFRLILLYVLVGVVLRVLGLDRSISFAASRT